VVTKLIAAAIIAALVVCAGAGFFFVRKNYPWVFLGSQTVRIATLPVGSKGEVFLSAFMQEIGAEHARIRVSLVETPGLRASAQAFKERAVDAAVVRSDDPAVTGGRSILVLRTIYAALLVPAGSPIDSVSKLKGKKIGVVTDESGIDPMAKAVLDFYGFDEKYIVRFGLNELSDPQQLRQVAALLVIGPSGAGPIALAVEDFRKMTRRPPKFLDLVEAPSITDRFPVYDEAEINVGAFSGSPAIPPEKVTTISAKVLLVAQASLSNHTAKELTRVLLATKAKVITTLPEAGHIAAPSTDKDELLPAHPGTVAFLEGEQTNLLDDTMNWIFLGSMLTGLLGSVAAWLNKSKNKKKRDGLDDELPAAP
jgi:TRAP-type uncharacterized transport system substrate-binding protein